MNPTKPPGPSATNPPTGKDPAKHVPVKYPTIEDGLHSGQHLGKMALGQETLTKNEAVAHAWVLGGAGLGQVFPVSELIGNAPGEPCKCPPELRDELCELARQKEAGVIDWKTYVKLALTLILKLLVCVVIVLMLTPRVDAATDLDRARAAMALAMAEPSEPIKTALCTCFLGDPCNCGVNCPCGALKVAKQEAKKKPAKKKTTRRVYRVAAPPRYIQPTVMRFNGNFAGNCSGGK